MKKFLFTILIILNYLSVQSQQCIRSTILTADPLPVAGFYSPDTTVTFYFAVNDYNQVSISWLHGIVPEFGSGWDTSTFKSLSLPPSCDGHGYWSYYNHTITGYERGIIAGPGFFYESNLGEPNGVTGSGSTSCCWDNNPGNNYGDNNPSNLCDWTFSWSIRTKPVNQCQQSDLSLKVHTYGDGQTGSWTSFTCDGDIPTAFNATLSCCTSPIINLVNTTCGLPNASANATGSGNSPWTYNWFNSKNVLIKSTTRNSSDTISGLASGDYSVVVINISGCSSYSNFTIAKSNCIPPSNISAGSITTSTAKISWATQPCAIMYQIQYRPTGTTLWTTINLLASTKTITGLTSGMQYDIQIRTKCSTVVYSDWSSIKTFTTISTCNLPTGVVVFNIQKARATIKWNAATNAYSYKLRQRIQGTTTWKNYVILAPATLKVIAGLTANTTYEFQLQTVCGSTGIPVSTWSAIQTFTTAMRMEEGYFASADNDILIYPNPVSEQLTVNSNQLIDRIEIRNVLGQIVTMKNISAGANKTEMDVSGLAQGIYFLSVKTAVGDSVVKKFLKE